MRKLIGLSALAAVVWVSCVGNTEPQANVDNWNNLRSSFGESAHYTGDSPVAQAAVNFYTGSSTVNSVYSIGHFDIYLASVVTNANGTQTWTYNVTKTANGPGYNDLSHLDVSFANCASANFASYGGGSWGPDPSNTCQSGDVLKWNWGFSYGQTGVYSFTTTQVYNVGTVTGIVKFANQCLSGSLPGPDCSNTGGTTPPTTTGGCPPWLNTLTLSVSIAYSGHHGYCYNGFPIYYLGDTMHGAISICNPTSNNVDNLTVTAYQETYPAGTLVACGTPVQTWTTVTVAPNDCLTLANSFYLAPSCPWGNYRTHIVIVRDADANCPTAALMFEDEEVGVYDPPAEG